MTVHQINLINTKITQINKICQLFSKNTLSQYELDQSYTLFYVFENWNLSQTLILSVYLYFIEWSHLIRYSSHLH